MDGDHRAFYLTPISPLPTTSGWINPQENGFLCILIDSGRISIGIPSLSIDAEPVSAKAANFDTISV
jgi:hypothetical protein